MSNFRKFSFERRTYSIEGQCVLLEALASEQGRDGLPYILNALKEGLPAVRACAARVLSQLPPDFDVVSGLVYALTDADVSVRRNAVESLCLIKPIPVAAIPALLEALDDSDVLVREVALDALQEIQSSMIEGMANDQNVA